MTELVHPKRSVWHGRWAAFFAPPPDPFPRLPGEDQHLPSIRCRRVQGSQDARTLTHQTQPRVFQLSASGPEADWQLTARSHEKLPFRRRPFQAIPAARYRSRMQTHSTRADRTATHTERIWAAPTSAEGTARRIYPSRGNRRKFPRRPLPRRLAIEAGLTPSLSARLSRASRGAPPSSARRPVRLFTHA